MRVYLRVDSHFLLKGLFVMDNRKIKAIIGVIGGALVSILGVIILIMTLSMIKYESTTEGMASNIILASIFLALTVFAGIMPLRRNIKVLKNKEASINTKDNGTINLQQTDDNIRLVNKSAQMTDKVSAEDDRLFGDNRVFCRDKQFDNEVFFYLFYLLIFGVIIGIFGGGFALYNAVAKTVNYRIQPGSWQALASLWLVIGVSVGVVSLILAIGKYFSIGNKYICYIMDKDKGLFFAHMADGRLGAYIEQQANLKEKIKATPSILYLFMYMICAMGRNRRSVRNVRRAARMERYFKINKKYKFAEKLLASDEFEKYCHKIVGVRSIKYFSKGCKVKLVWLNSGYENEENYVIYRNTENYALLIEQLKLLASDDKVGQELGVREVKQVREIIGRRICAILAVVTFVMILAAFGLDKYYENSDKANLYSGDILGYGYQWLANRRFRTLTRGIVGVVLIVVLGIGKLISDMIRINIYSCVPADMVIYWRVKRKPWQALGKDYKYFAKVKYKDGEIVVCMSKAAWNSKEIIKPMLVLRKGIPYCIVESGVKIADCFKK